MASQTLNTSNASQGTQTRPGPQTHDRATQNDADTYLAEFPDTTDLMLHLQDRVATARALVNAQEGVHLDQVEQLTEQYHRGLLELLRRMGFDLPANTTMGEIWTNLVLNPQLEHLAPFAMDRLHELAGFHETFQHLRELSERGTQTSPQVTPPSSPSHSPMDVDAPPPSRRNNWRRFLTGMRYRGAHGHLAYSRNREGDHLDPRDGFWTGPRRTQPDRAALHR
jgi:hypothetical protein